MEKGDWHIINSYKLTVAIFGLARLVYVMSIFYIKMYIRSNWMKIYKWEESKALESKNEDNV